MLAWRRPRLRDMIGHQSCSGGNDGDGNTQFVVDGFIGVLVCGVEAAACNVNEKRDGRQITKHHYHEELS